MIDPELVEKDPERVRRNLLLRRADEKSLSTLDRIIELGKERKAAILEKESCLALRNKMSLEIGALMKAGRKDEAEGARAQVREAGDRAKELETLLDGIEAERTDLLMRLPNLIDERVKEGHSADDNEIVRVWGQKPSFDFAPKPHDELGLIDGAGGAKLTGARFTVLRGATARLERALISFFLDLHTSKHGYTELVVPYMVWRDSMEGTGQLPKFEDDMFKLAAPVNGKDAFLVPTAEVPVTNLVRDEILEEAQLPMAFAAFTPCFRAEAGSYGKDTRGLIRQHQFHKVELVRITTPETSAEHHEQLTAHAEACLQALGLHYRVMRLCSGDIGNGARHCYDLEVWLPGQDAFREISSCSNFGDYQARRMKARYRPAGGGKVRLVHTINGSGLAVGRTLVAVLENYQQADGSVIVPEVLRPYMGGLDRIPAGH